MDNDANEKSNNDDEKLIFVTSGVSTGIQLRLADFVGVTEKDVPALFIVKQNPQKPGQAYKYKLPQKGTKQDDITSSSSAMTEDKMRNFINDY